MALAFSPKILGFDVANVWDRVDSLKRYRKLIFGFLDSWVETQLDGRSTVSAIERATRRTAGRDMARARDRGLGLVIGAR